VDEVMFGRYRVISLIGEGGMGKVFKAHDTVIDRDVAIKVLPAEVADEPGYRQRFRREAHIAARLTEPHIIPIHDTGDIDGHLYLVMPIIDGLDLASVLKRDGPMSPQLAVRVIEQLAAALDAAHTQGLVHRDVKPSNALITAREFVYLIDFGIAHDAEATHLTRTGSVMGTFAYMAPERLDGKCDARADTYALACVLHECLTGNQPFPGDSIPQQIRAHLVLDPPRPSVQRPGIPAAFDAVIARGMAKNPDQRYHSAQELATAAVQAITVPAAPAQPSEPTMPAPVPTDVEQLTTPSRADPAQLATKPGAALVAEAEVVSAVEDRTVAPVRSKRRLARTATVLPALLAILLVAAATFAGIEAARAHGSAPAPSWQPYVEAAKTMAQDLTTINYQSVDADMQRILDNATGAYYDDFSKRSEPFKQVVRDAQSVSTGTVTGAGLESLNGAQAQVLVAVSVKTTNAGKPDQQAHSWRMRITVNKTGGQYKTSNTEFVP
jgi:predicted Ser/Thr protein kinase